MTRYINLLVIVGIILVAIIMIRGDEDTWLCQNDQWVKHGNPSAPKPTSGCNTSISPTQAIETNSAPLEQKSTKQVIVYFSNRIHSNIPTECGDVFGVERTVAKDASYDQVLEQLFNGPTREEQSQGYASFFSGATANILKEIKVNGSTAYINLTDIRKIIPNASTSCGSKEFFSQVEETLKQDKKINKVIYAINGDPKTFYEWMQMGCFAENNNCDSTPFK